MDHIENMGRFQIVWKRPQFLTVMIYCVEGRTIPKISTQSRKDVRDCVKPFLCQPRCEVCI